MTIDEHTIGICSWSLRTADLGELSAAMQKLGLAHTQLALGRLLDKPLDETRAAVTKLRDGGVTITAGMIGFPGEDYSTISMIRQTGGFVPELLWPQRREIALAAGKLAAELKISAVSTHIGFVPPSSDSKYQIMVQRIGEIAAAYDALGLVLLMETGQERAAELLQFLNDLGHKNVQANFDPANMILYGAGDPIEAIATLGRHIGHVHVKDAILSDQPGLKWGREVPFGKGQVDARKFLAALKKAGYTGPLIIECEAGDDRFSNVSTAIATLQSAAKT